MKKKSSNLARLRRALWHRSREDEDIEHRKDYRHLHEIALEAEEEVEDMIEDMEMMSIRNPGFPDDYVGRPDDDFEPPDTDEDEKKDS